jgi:predicted ArsR family transcriptional regulator
VNADLATQVSRVAALKDPVRRSLYELVASSDEAVGRDQAAAATGVPRALAAFHLDRLAEEGLLEVTFRRLTGRTGPGAGRPAKLYQRSAAEIEVTLPPRAYLLAAGLMAEAIERAERRARPVAGELEDAARELGRRLGEEAATRAGTRASRTNTQASLVDVLRDHGYEPRWVDHELVLANCPFHALAQQSTDLVCGMNLHVMEGARSVLDLPTGELVPQLDPEPGRCCVTFVSGSPRERI